MKIIKKILLSMIFITILFLISCSLPEEPDAPLWGETYTTYTAYSKAQNLGYKGTYQEFMDSIKGSDGINGVGINIIEIVDGELVITLSNGTVTNLGSIKGNDGVSITNVEVINGELIITLSNGTITNVGKVSGIDGINGKSAYELYKETYEYSGTEEQWLKDLINGNLGTIKTHKVTFNLNGGTGDINTQLVKHGEKVTKPITPVKEGYEFAGWYVDDEKWSFIGYVVTEDIMLSAKWQMIDLKWSLGTLIAATGKHDASDKTRISTLEYIPVDNIEAITINLNFQMTWLAYDENKNYIGNGNITSSGLWMSAGKTLFIDDIITLDNNDGKNTMKLPLLELQLKKLMVHL